MQLILNEQDIEQLNSMIKKTPFEFAYPLFQFFRNKISQQEQKDNTKPDELPIK